MKVYEITIPEYQKMVDRIEDKTPILDTLRQMIFGKDEFFPYDQPGELEQEDTNTGEKIYENNNI